MSSGAAGRPYLDFYASHNITPVRQEIADLPKHFERREALYRHLGIAPGLIAGKEVIEFGPGTGQNALYTTALRPARYVLVDGNPPSLEATRNTLAPHGAGATRHEIVDAQIEKFRSEDRFDLALCEGVIPFQLDPAAFARHVGSFVRPSGVLVITCIDGVSFLGEATRRLLADALVPFAAPAPERLERLRPVFAPHLATLKGMSRAVDDWIYDNLLVRYHGRLFSVRDAIEALRDSFDVYGASPSFVTDWRWYKDVLGDARRYNERGIEQYLANVFNLADYRVTLPPQDTAAGSALLEDAEELFHRTCQMEEDGDRGRLPGVVEVLRRIASRIAPASAITARSLGEIADVLAAPPADDPNPLLPTFASFFGRGQQYLSFIRR